MSDQWDSPPLGLRSDLAHIYALTANVGMITTAFVSHPDRGDLDAAGLRAWLDPWDKSLASLDAELTLREITLRGNSSALWDVCRQIWTQSRSIRNRLAVVLMFLESPALCAGPDGSILTPDEHAISARKNLVECSFEGSRLCALLRNNVCNAATVTQAKKVAVEGNDNDKKRDGPFGIDGFRFRGYELHFGRATLLRRLIETLWIAKEHLPREACPVEEVLASVYGEENETSEGTFRQLCSEARGKFRAANIALDIVNQQGKVALVPLPGG